MRNFGNRIRFGITSRQSPDRHASPGCEPGTDDRFFMILMEGTPLKRFLAAVRKRCDFFRVSGSGRCDGRSCSSSMPYCPYGAGEVVSAVSRKRRKWRYECGCEGKEVLVIMPFGLPVRSREFVLYPPPAAVCRCSCAPEAWPKKSDNRKGSGNNRFHSAASLRRPGARHPGPRTGREPGADVGSRPLLYASYAFRELK